MKSHSHAFLKAAGAHKLFHLRLSKSHAFKGGTLQYAQDSHKTSFITVTGAEVPVRNDALCPAPNEPNCGRALLQLLHHPTVMPLLRA